MVVVLWACGAKGPASDPSEFPDTSGCTSEWTARDAATDALLGTYVVVRGAEERATYARLDTPDGTEEAWLTYTADGCLSHYEHTATDYEYILDSSCFLGFPFRHDAVITSAGERTELWGDVETTRLATLPVLQVTSFEDSTGAAWVQRESWTWEQGFAVAHDVWDDQVHLVTERWERDEEGRALVYEGRESFGAPVVRVETTRDAIGRPIEELHADGVSPFPTRTVHEWMPDRYVAARTEEDVWDDGDVDTWWTTECVGEWPWSCTTTTEDAWFGVTFVEEITWSCP